MGGCLKALAAACVVLGATSASAAADTTSFAYTGGEQTFTVPAGVTSVHVVAVGAKGGNGITIFDSPGIGGFGAIASADVGVSPGQVLHVFVGGTGANGAGRNPSAGGFNGGGAGGSTASDNGGAGAGGGASDVRTGSDLPSRVVTAGGGGGGGAEKGGGAGGAAGADGVNGSPAGNGCVAAAIAGHGGTPSAGGAAGSPASGGTTTGPTAGTFGAGGSGGFDTGSAQGGGGGGGGLYGGGGGGAGVGEYGCAGAGGGGGGSGFSSSATNTSVATDSTGTPSVTITYTPASTGGNDTPPPGGGGGPAPPPPGPNDAVKPIISLLTLTPSKFVAANIGPTISASVGTRVVYELSEAATMTFTVEQALPGRKKGRTCLAPGKAKRGKKCTRYVRVKGSFAHSGAKGLNSFRFMGRLRGKGLKPGNYRLAATAADAAGNRSAVKRETFRVVRG